MVASPTVDAPATSRRPSANISRVPYLPGLDGMRAFAVVAVMIYHANSSWLKGGFIGVEVFFVISGYLITLLLIAEHEKTGKVSMRTFWLRRARRLLPGAVPDAAAVDRVDLAVRTQRARQAARRRDRRSRLRVELVSDLHRRRIQRKQRLRPAPSPLEPRCRGAVLPGVADRHGGAAAQGQPAHRRPGGVAVRRRSRHRPHRRGALPQRSDQLQSGEHSRRVLADRRTVHLEGRCAVPVDDHACRPGCCSAPRSRWSGVPLPSCVVRCGDKGTSSTRSPCSGSGCWR